jgi:hypothetical protein
VRYCCSQHSFTHSWSWALLEKPPVVHELKNFSAFYETRRFNTMFTRALHLSLSWDISIQSILFHPIALWSILILFAHLRLGLPSCLLLSGFPTNILHAFLFSPIRATGSGHLTLPDLIIQLSQRVQVMKTLIMYFRKHNVLKCWITVSLHTTM